MQEINVLTSGKDREFEALYKEAAPQILRYMQKILGASQHAQELHDIVNVAFMKAWRTRESFRGDAQNFIRFVNIVAKNTFIDRTRRSAVKLEVPSEPHELSELGHALAFEDNVIQRLWLRGFLARLSDGQRACIVLMYYHDLSVREIAEVLGIPEATVKTRCFRARQELRGMMLGAE